jgi:hypothetical protein
VLEAAILEVVKTVGGTSPKPQGFGISRHGIVQADVAACFAENNGGSASTAMINNGADHVNDSQSDLSTLLPGSITPVAQNPRSIGIVCWCPEIFLTVQGRRRLLSRSSVKDVGNV